MRDLPHPAAPQRALSIANQPYCTMGKKKASFIDKKNSTTYSLTYGGHDDDDAPDAVSMSQGSASRYDDGQSAYGPSAYGSESAYG